MIDSCDGVAAERWSEDRFVLPFGACSCGAGAYAVVSVNGGGWSSVAVDGSGGENAS